MSIIESKTILFIQSPSHNMKPVEHFLRKRDFKVFCELDVKMAMVKVVELQPSLIFIAWDHPNQKVTELPKLLAQASQATVIPYVMNYTKEEVRKLDLCPLNPKLYPPVSGPAVERLITKFSKIAIKKNSDYMEIVNKYKSGQEAIDNINKLGATEKTTTPEKNFTLIRQQNLKKRSELIFQYKNKSLPGAVATNLKNSFQTKIKLPMEKLLKTLTESLIETEMPGTQQPIESVRLKAYCLPIFSNQWCGYLTITSNKTLEFSTIDIIFSEWIKEHFENALDFDEQDYIELENPESDFSAQLSQNADYFEKIEISGYDINISFVSIDSNKMNIELNDENNLIKISTVDITPDIDLKYSLHLHLPENKKYIVYTQANKKLSLEQKNRLLTNKIITLYTPIEFENEYKKFMIEKNMTDFYLNTKKKS